jgi:hypothetical protein
MVMPLEQMPVQAAGAPSAVQGPPPIEFDAPGASNVFSQLCNNAFVGIGCGTTALANNDSGQVVGTYTDAQLVQHGFLRAPNNTYTSIDPPGTCGQQGPGQGTVAYSINNAGCWTDRL